MQRHENTVAKPPATKGAVLPASPGERRIVVLIPCLNEEQTVAQVVRDFRSELPGAQIVVYDNASIDRTAQEAMSAGANVVAEQRRGKGFVVQSMFQREDADIYVLVDGDDTYPAECVRDLIAPLLNGQADMVVGSRMMNASGSQFRALNWMGNRAYQKLVNMIFGARLTDILSGYRVMNRRLVKGLPLFVTGFEVEVELTIKAMERGYRILELPVCLRSRPQGSHSKIKIWRDGWKILLTILALFRDYKSLTFFGCLGGLLILPGFVLGAIPIYEYLTTGLVLRFPTAILAVGLVITGLLLVLAGMMLHTVNRRVQELEYYTRLLTEKRDMDS